MKNVNEEKSGAVEKFKEFLRQKKMRQTSERVLIVEKIYSKNTFFSAQALHEDINKDIHVSLATIYSTLNLLLECNLIIRHNFNSQNILYEKFPSGANSYYRICIKCNKVKAFTDKKLKKSIDLRNSTAFSIGNHTLYLYGICKKCKEKMTKAKC
jgi:ferric uptake regulation protein